MLDLSQEILTASVQSKQAQSRQMVNRPVTKLHVRWWHESLFALHHAERVRALPTRHCSIDTT